MRKMYIQPTMVAVKLQHQTHPMQASKVGSLDGNSGMTLGGSDASYVSSGGDVRTKESSSIWDEDW